MIRVHSPEGVLWKTKRSKRICSVPVRRYTDDTKTQYTLMVCAKLNKPHHTYYTLDVKRPNGLVLPQPTKLERETFETLEEKFPIPATKYLHCKQRLRLELHSKQMEVFQRRRDEFANQVRREMEKKQRQQGISIPVGSIPKEIIEDVERCNQTVKDAAPQTKARVLIVSQDDIVIINALLQTIYFAPRYLVPYNDRHQLSLLPKDTEAMDVEVFERHENPSVDIAYMYTISHMQVQFAILTYARRSYHGFGEAITCTSHKFYADTRVHMETAVQRLMPRRVHAIMFSPDIEDTDTGAMAVEVCERYWTPSDLTEYKIYLQTISYMLLKFATLAYARRKYHGFKEAISCTAHKVYVDTRAYMKTGVQSLMPRRVRAIMFSPNIGDPFNTDTEAMVVEVYEQHVTPYVLTDYKMYLQTTCIPNMLLEFFILTYARRYHGIKEAITCTSYKFYADTREENRESSQEIETSHNDLHDANIEAQVKWNLKQIHELREIAVENREHAPAFEGMDTTPDKYACDVTKPTIYNDDNDEGMFGGILGVYAR